MEKLICNTNLIFSAKAPWFEQSLLRFPGGWDRAGEGLDIYSRHFLFLFSMGGGPEDVSGNFMKQYLVVVQ